MQLAPSSTLNNTAAIFPKYNCSSTSPENSLEYILHDDHETADKIAVTDCSDDILSMPTFVSPIHILYKYKQQNNKLSSQW